MSGLEEIAGRIKTKYNSVDMQNDEVGSFRWAKNGYTILLPTTEGFHINKYGSSDLEYDSVPTLFEKELFIARSVLKKRGYTLDINNSSSDFSDRTFYDYVQSYKKDDELCVLNVNPDAVEEGYQFSFSCGQYSAEAYEVQLPFLEALDLQNKNTIARLRNREGAYYQVGIGAVRGGSAAVLKKEGDEYRVLFVGQEAPNCTLMLREEIPKEVLTSVGNGSCFTDEGEYVRVE